MQSILRFEPGNLGPLNLEFAFKPPTGIGLSIKSGPVTGGGFLSLDIPNGRYAGLLQLSINALGITAIGLLDTKLPGGKPGFSFLLIITVKFSPIQLVYGFALTGLGGLAGIHRSLVKEALQDGVRNQSLDHIMFPDDPVKNAPRLINDLRTIFPPTENVYVFGPLVRLVWTSAKTIIEAELGVILQLPDPLLIVILGQFNIVLPDKAIPQKAVELHLDVVGVIDITNKSLEIDASLHHSRVGIFDIAGDMAMRLSWGDPPSFLLSVGGWNPHFQPPPKMPELRRLTLSLATTDNPRVRLEAYFALTSNTVQFGARAELYASYLGFTINGWFGFDALFYFQPRFAFRLDLDAGAIVKRGDWEIASITIKGTLTGPSPYHIQGEATFYFIAKIHYPLDETFGDYPQEEAPAIKQVSDLWSVLEKELGEPRNWIAALPPTTQRGVVITTPDENIQIFDPLGELIVRQRLLPLNRSITRFGEVTLDLPARFEVNAQGNVDDYFAPAQFEDLTEAEKLTRPSFDQMRSGVQLAAGNAMTLGHTQTATFDYEAFEIDAEVESIPQLVAPFLTLAEQVDSFHSAVGLETFAPSHLIPPLVSLRAEEYVVWDGNNVSATLPRDAAYDQAKRANPPLTVILSTDWEA